MSIGNGMISYRAHNGIHNFDIPVKLIRQAKQNLAYLAAYMAFHIRLKKGIVNYNFVVVNQRNQPQSPHAILAAIWSAMGK